jgi:hypothetical protein
MTRKTNDESAPIVSHGWLTSEEFESQACKPLKSEETLVAVYGMSHVGLLGGAIAKVNSKYVIRYITAPGAIPTWSLAAFQLDMKRCRPDVAIFGIMTDAVPLVSATSGATAYFDMCYPYTFPRYIVNDGRLQAAYPPFVSVGEYRDYFYSRRKWSEYRTWLEKHDAFYDPLLFERSFFDHSSIIRMIRRAYFEFRRKERLDKIYGKDGFNAQSEDVKVLRLIVREFAKSARERNIIPVIYIVNNQGRSDHLYKILKPVLDADTIPFFSTDTICPPDNPRFFLANSHFTPDKDLEIAQEIIKIIERERKNLMNHSGSQYAEHDHAKVKLD